MATTPIKPAVVAPAVTVTPPADTDPFADAFAGLSSLKEDASSLAIDAVLKGQEIEQTGPTGPTGAPAPTGGVTGPTGALSADELAAAAVAAVEGEVIEAAAIGPTGPTGTPAPMGGVTGPTGTSVPAGVDTE